MATSTHSPLAPPTTQCSVCCRWQLDASSQQAQLLEQQLTQQLVKGWPDLEACRAYLIDIMRTCRESKIHLSSQLGLRLVAYLTQHRWWAALEAVIRQQPLTSLAACPGLLLTLCQQGQFSMLPSLLTKVKPCCACTCTKFMINIFYSWCCTTCMHGSQSPFSHSQNCATECCAKSQSPKVPCHV